MNRTKIKNYAPRARREFIQAVTDRAAFFGLTAKKTEAVVEQGDMAIIGGRAFPKAVAAKRRRLEERVKRDGFEQTMEALAYTWFNRLVAIRYMELHGYLDHGYRVLSARGQTAEGSEQSMQSSSAAPSALRPLPSALSPPEILAHAEHLDLPGLNRETVIELKLAGDKEAELYRMLLVAQCNALHSAMPFLFERIDDETELVLPENLLHSDSLIRKLVGEIDEEDWQEVEIIGWIYQFYISEKKDQVIGKVVKSEDIPAATQLFTPNWIVKYLVQNSLGRQWLEHHPDSPLKAQMEYYIEPAEQTPEVQAQLQEIIRKRAADQHGSNTDENSSSTSDPCSVGVSSVADVSLNPEKLTLLDPACGSGHILVEAYDLFKAIYQERGYNRREIPRLILEKNLYGLEIDDRAAQLASLALMMKARADDRRIFDSGVKPQVLSIQESKGLDAGEIYHALASPLPEEQPEALEPPAPASYLFEPDDNLFTRATAQSAAVQRSVNVGFTQTDIASLLCLFDRAKTFGSLINVPRNLTAKLRALELRLNDAMEHGDLTHASARSLEPLLRQAKLLASRYDAVVANPPYMGGKYYSPALRSFVFQHYSQAKADLYSCFIYRNVNLAREHGFIGMITIPNWMFLSTFERMRIGLFQMSTIDTFVHNGRGAFGSDFGSCCFVFRRIQSSQYQGIYRRLFSKQGSVTSNEELRSRFFETRSFIASIDDLSAVPGSPVAYWIGEKSRGAFGKGAKLGDIFPPRKGIDTGNNERFLRFWYEVSHKSIGFGCVAEADAEWSRKRWFPYNKGGPFRKWFGNLEYVVDWENSGERIRTSTDENGKVRSNIRNRQFFFRSGVTWTDVSISSFGARWLPAGCICDNAGSACYGEEIIAPQILAFLTTPIAFEFLRILNPSLHFQAGNLSDLPVLDFSKDVAATIADICKESIDIAARDWNEAETAWDFQSFGCLGNSQMSLSHSFESHVGIRRQQRRRLRELEEENNRLFIEAYGLQDELSPEVPDDQITLYRPNREEDIKRLISYAIGCMMGRYSLDKPGLIYAHSGGEGFDPSQYVTFPADDDGLVPLLETDWGIPDDAANRLVEFINVCWPGSETTDSTDSTDDQNRSDTPPFVPSVKPVVKTSPHLEENLQFIADSLSPTRSEQSRDTIRRYLATGFFKHHLSMYKRRPIYWLFTSGKLRAFQCLVYLHRYNEGTLSRMRTEYVIPLQGKLAARAEQLATDIAAATSTSHRKKLEKERDKLIKQQVELQNFDEKLRHYADQRIALDLDDGVKVNYAKFGDLLAEVKAVTGAKA